MLPVIHCHTILNLSSLHNWEYTVNIKCVISQPNMNHRCYRERQRGTQSTDANVSKCTRIETECCLSHQEIWHDNNRQTLGVDAQYKHATCTRFQHIPTLGGRGVNTVCVSGVCYNRVPVCQITALYQLEWGMQTVSSAGQNSIDLLILNSSSPQHLWLGVVLHSPVFYGLNYHHSNYGRMDGWMARWIHSSFMCCFHTLIV